MPLDDLMRWLETRGFYALLVLVLLAVGLWLGRRRAHRQAGLASPARPRRRPRTGVRPIRSPKRPPPGNLPR